MLSNKARKTSAWSVLLLASVFLLSCDADKEVGFEKGNVPSSATGEAVVGPETFKGETRIATEFDGLPTKEDLSLEEVHLVIWAKGTDGEMERLGTVFREEENATEGNLVAATTKRNFKLMVTIEEDDDPDKPSDNVLLSTKQIKYTGK